MKDTSILPSNIDQVKVPQERGSEANIGLVSALMPFYFKMCPGIIFQFSDAAHVYAEHISCHFEPQQLDKAVYCTRIQQSNLCKSLELCVSIRHKLNEATVHCLGFVKTASVNIIGILSHSAEPFVSGVHSL